MAVRKTVRIYDLAKELKQDTKRVMEELRRAVHQLKGAGGGITRSWCPEPARSGRAEPPGTPAASSWKLIDGPLSTPAPTVQLHNKHAD